MTARATDALRSATLLQQPCQPWRDDDDLATIRAARNMLDDERALVDLATGFIWTVVGETAPHVAMRHRGTGRVQIMHREEFDAFAAGCITRARLEQKLREGLT